MQKSTGGNQSENLFVTKRKSQLTKQARERLIRKESDSYFHLDSLILQFAIFFLVLVLHIALKLKITFLKGVANWTNRY